MKLRNKFLISLFITLFSAFSPSFNIGAPNLPPQMQVVQMEKSTEISFSDEVSVQTIGILDEAINHNGQLVISYLSVGNADAIFIILPNNENLIIDMGEPNDANFIVNYIKGCNVDTIDYAVNTHPHNDHIGSFPAILRAFDVKNIFMPNVKSNIQAYKNTEKIIEEKGMEIKIAKAGVKLFDYPDLSAEFVAPNSDKYSNLNNYSAVIMLKYKETSFIFTGDCEALSENEILDVGYDIKADVLKVGHHGASTSSTESFIKAINPKYAVISCGKNSYGHPTQQTLATLENNNIEIWRTDLRGTITAVSDGFNVTLSSNYNSIEINAPPKEEPPSENMNPDEKIVYITKSGKRRHRGDCSYLSSSKIEVKLRDVADTHPSCQKCNPD